MGATLPDRFWSKVDKAGPISAYRPDLGNCWLWIGEKCGGGNRKRGSYGYFAVGGKWIAAHRISYEQEYGIIPDGLEPDHLCRVKHCVRPTHIEPVTRSVNMLRAELHNLYQSSKTHCPHGHLYTPENIYRRPDGERRCKTCEQNASRERQRIYRTAKNGS